MNYFSLFIDDIIEADNEMEAMEKILYMIMDDIGNYIGIEVEEVK